MTWVMVYMPGKTTNDICEYQNGCWAPPPPRNGGKSSARTPWLQPNYERWVHGAVFLLRLVI